MKSKRPFLVFRLEQTRFALDLAAVDRVESAASTAPLSHGPEHVRGLINISGLAIPVVDMRRLLGFVSRDMELEDRLILAESRGKPLALLVDQVDGVAWLSTDLVEWPQGQPGDAKPEFSEGFTEVSTILGDIVLVQDVDAVADAASLHDIEVTSGWTHD